jgi:hypothetical protein
MKKHFLLFASVAFSFVAVAQTKPSFGVRAGLSQSTLKGDAVNSFGNVLGFSNGAITSGSQSGLFGGVNARIPVSDVFSIEPGIYYSQKGYELNGKLNVSGADFLGVSARSRLTTHYIDLPVVLKANLNGFQVFAGPQVSYLAKADLRTTAGALGFNAVNTKSDQTGQLNRWDAGITAGVGYQMNNGFNVTAAYDHGLSRVNAGKSLEAYNRGFKVGVGFQF